jgi:hypothetical protein
VRNDAAINFNWGSGSPDKTVPANYFSVRWIRSLPFDGTCQVFHTKSDDGIRVFVDGAPALSYWTVQPFTDHWDTVCGIAAGAHTVSVEYFEAEGDAGAFFEVTPEAAPTNTWRGRYFNNETLSGVPALVRDETAGSDTAMAFDWGLGSPDTKVQADNFSVRWQRSITFDGTCQVFHTKSDDGIRVFLLRDGETAAQKVVDHWSGQSGVDLFDTVCPQYAGAYTVTVEFHDSTGTANVSFDVKPAASVPADYWLGTYFGNRYLDGTPAFTQNDAAVKFDWGAGSPAGLPADDFSIRWVRSLTFDGTCQVFHTFADDAIRIALDGQTIRDYWDYANTPGVEHFDPVCPSAGSHEVTLEYREITGNAKVSFDTSAAGALADGVWQAGYYANKELYGQPAVTGTTAAIDFNWGSGSPDALIPVNGFSARWERSIAFDGAPKTVFTRSDDGIRVFVDGVPVIAYWQDQAATDRTNVIQPSAGVHRVTVEYYENAGDAVAVFNMS